MLRSRVRPRTETLLVTEHTGQRRLIVDLPVGLAVGGVSGGLGVGGGIVLVPILVLIRHWTQKSAQATSLVVVAIAAFAGAVTYAVADSIAWLPAGVILIGGVGGAWLGSHLLPRMRDARLTVAFGILVIIVAARMIWPTPLSSDVTSAGDPIALDWRVALGYILSGLLMGLLSSMLGIGGGIVLVPLLVGLFGFDQQLAAGTSLAVMVPTAVIGAVRLSRVGLTDWRTGGRIGIGAILGSVLGAALALAAPDDVVRIVFGLLMAFVGVRMTRDGLRARSLPAE